MLLYAQKIFPVRWNHKRQCPSLACFFFNQHICFVKTSALEAKERAIWNFAATPCDCQTPFVYFPFLHDSTKKKFHFCCLLGSRVKRSVSPLLYRHFARSGDDTRVPRQGSMDVLDVVPFLGAIARCHRCGNVQIFGFGRGDINCMQVPEGNTAFDATLFLTFNCRF